MTNTTKAADAAATMPAAPAPKRITKTDQLVTMLRLPEGASIEEIAEELCWLPHTVRAALTGLKKKGLVVVRSKLGSVTVYKVSA